jgi:hypothetical protein
MEQIRVWLLTSDESSGTSAIPLAPLTQVDAEAQLEEALVRNPTLLGPNLAIVGRQTPTPGGPLDLLGVDEDGRLVVFELKRGVLAREVVAQVIDYASYLASLSVDELSRHLAERSGPGMEKIEDFEGWYQQHFPGRAVLSALPPRMVIVGLGCPVWMRC